MSDAPTIAMQDAPPPPSNPEGGANNPPPSPDAPFVPFSERVKSDAAAADAAIRALAEGRDPRNPDAPAPQPSPVPQIPPQNGNQPPQAQQPVTIPDDHPALAALRAELARAQNIADTERGRREAEVRRANERMAELSAQVEALTGKKAKDALADAIGDHPGLSAEQVETYGEDMLKAVAAYIMPTIISTVRKAVDGLRAEFKEHVAPVAERVQHVEETAAQRAEREFVEALDRALPADPDNGRPGWRATDNDPAFTAWLNEEDPISGLIRRSALDKHVANRDAARVAVIFNAFLGQRGGGSVQQPPGGTAHPAPAGGNAPGGQGSDNPTLADLAAPGGSRRQSDGADGAPQPKVWSRQEITDFYRDVGRGTYRDKPQERDRMEREIARAQREGRVRE